MGWEHETSWVDQKWGWRQNPPDCQEGTHVVWKWSEEGPWSMDRNQAKRHKSSEVVVNLMFHKNGRVLRLHSPLLNILYPIRLSHLKDTKFHPCSKLAWVRVMKVTDAKRSKQKVNFPNWTFRIMNFPCYFHISHSCHCRVEYTKITGNSRIWIIFS